MSAESLRSVVWSGAQSGAPARVVALTNTLGTELGCSQPSVDFDSSAHLALATDRLASTAARSPTGKQRTLYRAGVAVIAADEQVAAKVNSLLRWMRGT